MLKIGELYKHRRGILYGYTKECFDDPTKYCERHPRTSAPNTKKIISDTKVLLVMDCKKYYFKQYGEYAIVLIFSEGETLTLIEKEHNLDFILLESI